MNLNEYASPAQLNIVTILLLTPAFTNQTERVEKTKSMGKPEENPKKNILKEFKLKKFLSVFVVCLFILSQLSSPK